MYYPVRVSDVVSAGVEPEIRVPMLGAVLCPVVQNFVQQVGDFTVVAESITSCQDNDILVPWFPGISVKTAGVFGDYPVPFRLRLIVCWLRAVVARLDRYYGLAEGKVAVVLDGNGIAETGDENNRYNESCGY